MVQGMLALLRNCPEVSVCVCACVYACVSMYVFVYECVSMCVCVYICVCAFSSKETISVHTYHSLLGF